MSDDTFYIGWVYNKSGYMGRGNVPVSVMWPAQTEGVTHFKVYPEDIANFDAECAKVKANAKIGV